MVTFAPHRIVWLTVLAVLGGILVGCQSDDEPNQAQLCDPPFAELPCPRTYTDEEIEQGLADVMEYRQGGAHYLSIEGWEQHPFVGDYDNILGAERENWPFHPRSQVFICGTEPMGRFIGVTRMYGTIACQHVIFGIFGATDVTGGNNHALQCNMQGTGGLLCWSMYALTPEFSGTPVVCAPLPQLGAIPFPSGLELGNRASQLADFYAECGPLSTS